MKIRLGTTLSISIFLITASIASAKLSKPSGVKNLRLGLSPLNLSSGDADTQKFLQDPKAALPKARQDSTVGTSISCTDASGQSYNDRQTGFDRCMSQYQQNLQAPPTAVNPKLSSLPNQSQPGRVGPSVNFTYGNKN